MNRRYPERPMVGVAAIVFREDHVLLIRRGTEPSFGKWSLPGGLVEVGESLEESLRREVREEVGLAVTVKELVAVLDRVIPDETGKVEYHYILMDFLCEPEAGNPTPATDVTDCLFVPVKQLADFDLTRGTAEVIRRAYGRGSGVRFPIYDGSL
ncbi:MAG: NUDIX hydrolase [Syntrophobacteraceae bacterium]